MRPPRPRTQAEGGTGPEDQPVDSPWYVRKKHDKACLPAQHKSLKTKIDKNKTSNTNITTSGCVSSWPAGRDTLGVTSKTRASTLALGLQPALATLRRPGYYSRCSCRIIPFMVDPRFLWHVAARPSRYRRRSTRQSRGYSSVRWPSVRTKDHWRCPSGP